MGWSLPEVPEKKQAPAWSPWICLLIIVLGLFIGLAVAVLKSPTTGLPVLSSGYWLPLTIWIFTGISAAIAVYSFWWETLAFRVWNWNEWCRSMRQIWQKRAHQHLIILSHIFISADSMLLSRLVHSQEVDSTEAPPLTLLPGESLTPGISRFEQLSLYLIAQIKPSLLQQYPSGPLFVTVQTGGKDKDRELQSFHRIWSAESLPWEVEVHFQQVDSFLADWNQFVTSATRPVLVLAMHYRRSDDVLPEFASALFLMPPLMLSHGEQKNALRLFRAMPLNSSAIMAEIGELRDMILLPADKKHLVWFSGLSDIARQSVGRVLNDLSVPLCDGIGTGGVIDYDSVSARYGGVAGWAMIGAAADMAAYGPASQWILLEGKDNAWAVTLGNTPAPIGHDHAVIPPPFPVGSILMALLFSTGLFCMMIQYFPSVTLSWPGIMILLLSLAVTLPGIAFLLRHITVRLQLPLFVRAAQKSGRE